MCTFCATDCKANVNIIVAMAENYIYYEVNETSMISSLSTAMASLDYANVQMAFVDTAPRKYTDFVLTGLDSPTAILSYIAEYYDDDFEDDIGTTELISTSGDYVYDYHFPCSDKQHWNSSVMSMPQMHRTLSSWLEIISNAHPVIAIVPKIS